MTDTSEDRIAHPVPVSITNWAPPAKPPYVKNTTVSTIVVDPAGASQNKFLPLASYEPTRLRLAIIAVDSDIMITAQPPTDSPATSSTATPGNGAFLPKNAGNGPYEFFGPDALWVNSLTTITRVTVIKEYC